MPVYFLMHPTRMLEVLGKKTVVIQTTTNKDTKHATFALTIVAAGDQLVPMAVFKGTQNVLIKKCKLTLHDPTCIYKRQDNA
jgi:hypothetical protein